MSNELTDVRCPCGAEFQADSYDAGFIAGSGMCQNCDAALPPKDICTCPSGDGSLRWPCPKHPAVEQAGGDERAAFEAWLAQAMSKKFEPEFDLAKYEDSGEYRYSPAAAYWKAWQARADLAQPSPAPADEKPGDSILCSGCFAKGVGPEHFDEAGKCLVRQQTEPLGAEFAQVLSDNLPELLSTAQAEQAEAERPELEPHIPAQTIAEAAIEQLIKSGAKHYQEFHFDLHLDGHEGARPVVVTVAFSDGPSAHELRMKAEQERDAALARVAELTPTRNRYGVDAHYFNKNLQRILRDFESFTTDELARSLIILAKVADEKVVAQAQHSVPEGYRLIRRGHFAAIKAQLDPEQVDAYRGRNIYDEDKVYANWNACRSALDEIKDVFQQIDWDAENELAELLAAAPGKEVGHE
ncbi:hypothetical protein ACYTPM_24480 [Pseudomonas aeruginosa]